MKLLSGNLLVDFRHEVEDAGAVLFDGVRICLHLEILTLLLVIVDKRLGLGVVGVDAVLDHNV